MANYFISATGENTVPTENAGVGEGLIINLTGATALNVTVVRTEASTSLEGIETAAFYTITAGPTGATGSIKLTVAQYDAMVANLGILLADGSILSWVQRVPTSSRVAR